jgi:hypothetical protein
MTESQRSLLLQIAAEMVLGKGMPPEWIGDWKNIGKMTSRKTEREIEAAAKESRKQCHDWSRRIMQILNAKEMTE